MKRSKGSRSKAIPTPTPPLAPPECERCKITKSQITSSYAFKPLVFSELLLECGKNGNGYGFKKGECVPPKVPDPRSGHRIVCADGNLLSFGGYLETNVNNNWPAHLANGTQRLFQELWCYNFAEGQWKRLPTLGNAPKELASHSAVLHGNHLLVYGGTGVPFGGCSSNKMNICDLRTLEWRCMETTGEPPIPQYGQAVVLDTKLKDFYVIGGTTGYNYSIDIHKLNMHTQEWEKLFISRGDLDEPEPRYRHECAFHDDKIFILGGGTATVAYNLKSVSAFDVRSKQWMVLQTLPNGTKFPQARKCQGSVQLGEDVWLCGGYDSRSIFNDLWKLHLPTMQWTELQVKMPVPLYFHSTSITEAGCMYIFGGVTDMRLNTRTNQVFKVWLKLPKLKDICWEAILKFGKAAIRDKKSVADLIKIGVPIEYANLAHPAPPCGHGEGTSHHWGSKHSTTGDTLRSKVSDMDIGDAPVAIGY